MKRFSAVSLILCLVFCSCAVQDVVPEITTTEEQTTVEETTAAPVKVHQNPLNGTLLDEPYSGRVFSVTINNVPAALPHVGVGDADVFFEMYINDYCTRGLALYSDISKVPEVGSIRSIRYNFTDISKAYDTVMIYSGGSEVVLKDMNAVGIDNIAIDERIGYRDAERRAAGYSLEHTLFATGEALYNAAESKGYAVSNDRQDYGMKFGGEGTPANGSTADEIEIAFTLDGRTKTTTMKYDASRDEYIYWQYGEEMRDENTGVAEGFKNVFVVHAPMLNDSVYHVADIFGMGTGYYACGGKMIPVKWWVESPGHGFTFMTEAGIPILQEPGSTYIAIAPEGSAVTAK